MNQINYFGNKLSTKITRKASDIKILIIITHQYNLFVKLIL